MEPSAADDLPKSLEAIINQKIAGLDEESRGLLHQATTFGEDVALSLLTGGSEAKEARVLEFVDHAVEQGLLSSDFQLNDETIRFRGKRILEIADRGIQPEQKRQLHERIGNYQETLYQRRLLTSAAPVAYHFKLSSNREKAGVYERFQAGYTNKVFSTSEAILYSGETRAELALPGTPLDPASLAYVPTVIRCLLTSLRNIRLYPPGSESVISAIHQVKEAIDPILAKNESLAIFKLRQALMINGQKLDVSEYKLVAEEFSKFLERVELQGVDFHQGLTEKEVEVLLDALGRTKPQMIDKDYWQRFSADHQLVHADLKQVKYTVMMERGKDLRVEGTSPEKGKAAPRRSLAQLISGEQKLDREDWAQMPDVMRALLNATKNIKIYPVNSKTVSGSIQQLLDPLQSILGKRHILTLAQVSNSLVANGVKIDTTMIEPLVEGVRKLLDSIMLTSLTFLEGLSTQELKTFLGALSQLPSSGMDRGYWARFGREQGLSNILLDQVLYETRLGTGQVVVEEEIAAGEELEQIVEEIDPVAEDQVDPFLKALPGQVNDLLMEGEEAKQANQMFRRLFKGFQDRPIVTREKVVENCRRTMEDLTLAVQHRYSKVLVAPMRAVFEEEKDSKVLREIASLLHRMATVLMQFAEYPTASRILAHLSKRHRLLEESKDPHAQRLAKILDRKLDPTIQKLLMGDMLSEESSRQENATLLLGSLGRVSIPLLTDVIKKSEDLRARQLAATMLGQLGTEGAELIKRDLVLEGKTEERLRILEVVDTITRDLKTELTYALADGNAAVRQAAFQLAERLNDSQVVNLILDYAKGPETDLALEAIECLGRLRPAAAVNGLVSLLRSSKEKERIIACCRALGQIADPASIDPLAKTLAPKGFLFRRKKKADIRAAAIFALGQISHPQVAKILALYRADPDPRVREIARTHESSGKPSSPKPPTKERPVVAGPGAPPALHS
jgi:HEAT repeat protein